MKMAQSVVMIPVGKGDSWDFDTIPEASEYFGVTPKVISSTIKKGTIIKAKDGVEYFLDIATPDPDFTKLPKKQIHRMPTSKYALQCGDKMVYGSVLDLRDFIGLNWGEEHLGKKLKDGLGTTIKAKDGLDYTIVLDKREKPTKVPKPKGRKGHAPRIRYELVAQSDGSVTQFSQYGDMARFLHKSGNYIAFDLVEGHVFSRYTDGEVFTLRLV